MNICQLLDQHVSAAFSAVKLPENTPTVIKPSARINFGHYQVNGVMGAAKKLRTNPRALAMQIVEQLDLEIIANKVEVAGPGFINIHLKPAWLAQQLEQASKNSDRIGVNTAKSRMTVVVDYSGPNLAKEMHVGHLRSSIIGDAVVRVLEFLGHKVIRQNHVGDWGTQFGMLIAHMQDQQQSGSDLAVKLADLESFYRESKLRFDQDADFATAAREYVVKLQSGDEQCKALWQQFIDISLQHCDDVYQQLNVSLQRSDVMPESAYNADLPHVISDLDTQGLLTHSDGAQVVFLDELKSKEGSAFPAIVQKSDGGYLYSTSDLAALRYRHSSLQADRVMYFVDARQSLHLQSVFLIAQKAGFVSEAMLLEHLPFGTMMGKDGKPFKTRAGGTVKLTDLLDEAEQRAYNLVSEKNPDLDEAEKQLIAHKVGIAAVKYADLSKNRSSDYIFNWDSMLSFEGNTAPYLQYAYTRINSIFKKAGQYDSHATLQLDKAEEQQLGLKILQFEEALQYVAKDAMPNMLCNYLYELSSHFMTFYEACPILKADQATKDSRLKLAGLTADTLKIGLDLLGIEVMERM